MVEIRRDQNSKKNDGVHRTLFKRLPILCIYRGQYQRTVFAIYIMIELFVFRQPHRRNKKITFLCYIVRLRKIQRDTQTYISIEQARRICE